MAANTSSIFRATAVRHYVSAKEEVVLPRMLNPRALLFLWMLLVLMGVLGVLAATTRVPAYIHGTAVVGGDVPFDAPAGAGVGYAVLIPLPDDRFPSVRAGQRVFIRTDGRRDRVVAGIERIEADVVSPAAVLERFGWTPAHPAIVAFARSQDPIDRTKRLSSAHYVGSVFDVQVEVGSTSLLSLLPSSGN